MRLSALVLIALCACAHAASIASTVPDKKDIEKKLTEVVKEVLSKDEVNDKPESELNEQPAPVKDIENNLKSVPIAIPVKVVIEPVHPAIKSDADKKENNEISESQESVEIKREEPDLKNPGLPQRMQHDSQHPETFDDASKKAEAQKEQWRDNPSYIILQKELQNLKMAVEAQIAELQKSLHEYWAVNPDAEKNDQTIKLRSSVKEDSTTTTTTTAAPFWSGNPLVQGWQNLQSNWQSNFGNFNNSLNEYFATQNQSSSCGSGWNWGGLGGSQSPGQSNSGTQSDEPRPPGLWQQVQQNVQNFLSGGAQQPPAGAQSDTPQTSQPNRPVIQAFQSAIQQAGSLFNRPSVQPVQPAQPAQSGQAEPQKVTSEGTNAVPAKLEEPQKQKPEQPVTQSGPIKQLIGSNPVVQGIAGAVQRIGQAVIPNKPRDDMKSANAGEKEDQDKGGLVIIKPKPPHPPGSGDNNDVNSSSSGIEVNNAPEGIKEQLAGGPANEAPEQIKEQPAAAASPAPANEPKKTE